MRVALFSAKPFEREYFATANEQAKHELCFIESHLSAETASLAEGFPAVSLFASDDASAKVLEKLKKGGTEFLALRSAGFNHVDLEAAEKLKITVARVPAYSPYAVAEHAIALMMSLNRKVHRAYNRVREQNFALDGLMGFDMYGKTAGVIGTGKIGRAVCHILNGFGCQILAYDPKPSDELDRLNVEYTEFDDLLKRSDIVTLHSPLTPQTHHLINKKALQSMKAGAMLINTSRGALVDAKALIDALKSGHIGSVGLDVYEEEGDLFFQDLSDTVITDDVFMRLMTFPNVLITAHQGFFTHEACKGIADTTIENLTGYENESVAEENLVTTDFYAS